MAYVTPRTTVRLNYVDQARAELPLLQTRAGNRKGPFAEFAVRPITSIELFASANFYQSHPTPTERDTLRARSMSGGFHARLPFKFDLTSSVTQIRAFTLPSESRHRQITVVLSRPIGRSTLRFSARELQLRDASLPSRQRSYEVENTHMWRRLIVSGAIRMQQSAAQAGRTTAFGREQVQLQLRKFTLFQNLEYGRDLANATLFASNTFQTTSAGVSWRPSNVWSVEAEVFRNRLATYLNPLQEFILGGSGLGGNPLLLSGFNQLTLYVRVSRSFTMGPAVTADRANRAGLGNGNVVLTGSIDGIVTESPTSPVPDIAVQLDEDRVSYTDAKGHYRFADVTDGPHSVRFAPRELPAEYDPVVDRQDVLVRPGRVARADLRVHVLSSLHGRVLTEAGAGLSGVLLQLQPHGLLTTTDEAGAFSFHNLRPGSYTVKVDAASLPPRHTLLPQPDVMRMVDPGKDAPALEFRVRVEPERAKPVRVIQVQR